MSLVNKARHRSPLRARAAGCALCVGLAVAGTGPIVPTASADTASVCSGTTAFSETLAALQSDGWTLTTEAPDDRDLLAWTLMIPYVNGDRGGETTETLLDLQRLTVPGLFAKRDTDTTKARVLLRDGGALTVTETRTLPDRVERVCHVASQDTAVAVTGALDTSGFDGAPEVLAQIITILPEPSE